MWARRITTWKQGQHTSQSSAIHRAVQSLADINWADWKARDEATLLFVVTEGRVLLMHKKRGLGAGKVNAPGGRVEPGETAEEGAIREVREELEVTPQDPRKFGELSFQFLDGYSIFVHVFRARDYHGVPKETAEAIPLWVSPDQIPYSRMWADDALWVPLLLAGRWFSGRFLFDNEKMLDHQLEEYASAEPLEDPRAVKV